MTYPIEQRRTRNEVPWIATACVLIGLLLVAFGTISRVGSQMDAKTSLVAAKAPQQ
jgi:hypothetical protein